MAETEVLPEGTLVEVIMLVRLPCAAARDQVEDWLNHNIGQCGSINIENPLYRGEPEAWGSQGLTWEDTGYTGKRVEFAHEDLGGGRSRCRVRYERHKRPA